ncbi:MAG: DUF4962 domain-containing protein, partial [Lentisphaerales bacterium]|nr:DUF4962 domain-containing protein [Lentisphaerales bacterium]
MYSKNLITLFLLTVYSQILFADTGYQKIGSEYKVTSKAIYPQLLDRAIPSTGKPVDRNPPYLAYNPWPEEMDTILKSLEGLSNVKRRQALAKIRLSRKYFFELSQDKTFSTAVMRSKAIGWAFWNPFQELAVGHWYWRVTHKIDKQGQPLFNGLVHHFVMTEDAQVFVPPSTDKMLNLIQNMGTPRITYKKSMLGKIRQSLSPEALDKLIQKAEEARTKKIVCYNEIYNQVKTKKLTVTVEKAAAKSANKTINKLIKENCEAIKTLITAYIMTGKEKYYKDTLMLFKKVYKVHAVYQGKHIWSPSTFHGNKIIATIQQLLDVFGDKLDSELRKELVQRCVFGLTTGSDNFAAQVARSEYKVYDSHLWQTSVYNSLKTSIALLPYTQEAEIWFKYFYNLWLFRAPAGSRTDGGWNADFSYFDVNQKALLQGAWILTQISGFNFFDVPWYKNFAHYLSFAETKGNPKTTFGDRTYRESIGRGDYMKRLSEIAVIMNPGNYWNRWRFYNRPNNTDTPEDASLKPENWYLNMARLQYKKDEEMNDKPIAPTKHRQAALFQDIGFVGAFSDMTNPTNNMLVQFKASNFGAPNHALPAQNAFNLSFGRESLCTSTGHRHSTLLHNKFDFDNSRAHNTIVPDGLTQSSGTDGFGWVPRFAHGENATYFIGDASSAYQNSQTLADDDKTIKATTTSVNRFRRHMLILRPNILLIYDELAADTPYEWQFKLHSLNQISQLGKNSIKAFNNHVEVKVHFWGSDDLKINISDQYKFPAVNVRGKKVKGKLPLYQNAWHLTTIPVKKQAKFRYLTIMQIAPESGDFSIIEPNRISDNEYQIADYSISCQLDVQEPSFLKVIKTDQSFALVTGQAAEKLLLENETIKAK